MSQIEKRWDEIATMFSVIEQFAVSVTKGKTRFLIVSGAPGLGKSYGIFNILKKWDRNHINHCVIKGYATAPALFRKLFEYKEKGQVLVLDDADGIFKDEKGMNILKAATDTLPERIVSYSVEKEKDIPRQFVYEGSVILITNYDFDTWLESGGKKKIVDHFRALLDRGRYVNIGINEHSETYADDCLIRIYQAINEGLLGDLTEQERFDVISYMKNYKDKLRNLSLRMAEQLGELRTMYGDKWEQMVPITCWKR